jgi:hypothetical protein
MTLIVAGPDCRLSDGDGFSRLLSLGEGTFFFRARRSRPSTGGLPPHEKRLEGYSACDVWRPDC